MEKVLKLSTKLSKASRKFYNNPYQLFDWPECVSSDKWYFSPELISIYHTPYYGLLSEEQQKKLSFWEAVNFFSLNIHGEKSLLQGLTHRLYAGLPEQVSEYLHHFVDEENKHMSLFGSFCLRYGSKIYPSKAMVIPREYKRGEESFLFFAKVVIFEELVDYYNAYMGEDDRLDPLAREINRYHHNDETRHLAFGRAITRQLFDQYAPSWGAETIQDIRNYLSAYIAATWKEYYNPGVYDDAGLPDSYQLYQSVWKCEESRSARKKAIAKCINFFMAAGILTEEPQL